MPTSALAQASAELAQLTGRLEDEARRILKETSIPAISIAVVRSGEVVWANAFGLANVSAAIPATPETYFSTGSTLKPATAAAVMQLVDAGRLTLDSRFNAMVPEALAIRGADDVTLRHLLAHHSGLEGPVDIVSLWSREPVRSPEETIRAMRRTGPPGAEYRYCNECYTMAGYLVEILSGMSYDAYLAERIFRPLGSEFDSPSIPTPGLVERLALPYTDEGGVAVPIKQIRTNVFAAGDAYLRATDMAAFLAALLNGGTYRGQRILSSASAAEILRRHFDSNGSGLGFNLSELDGRAVVTKNGIFTGYHSFMIGDPATRHGAYVVANSTAAGRVVASLARLALRLLWGEEVGASRAKGTSRGFGQPVV
jgi:CubicO group peptidase (beta-lactamase class C family)